MASQGPKPSTDGVSLRMAGQRTSGTQPEMALRRELHGRGRRFRIQLRPILDVRRTPDITFVGARVVVFVDGCFWHRCPEHGTIPKSNAAWWEAKLDANRSRDRETDRLFEDRGWAVVRVWEHEPPVLAADRVERVLTLAGRMKRAAAGIDDSSTSAVQRLDN